MQKIEINPQFQAALDLMENTSQNLFITGKAGTGKSTLLSYFMEKTKKRVPVLAPTGVAALNVKGETIHSFFKFVPGVTLETARKKGSKTKHDSLYSEIDAIVIDEISMVRADLLDCMDVFLRASRRKKAAPFGGVQMIFIGDLYQLPPVVVSEEREHFKQVYASPYFFAAKVIEDKKFKMQFIELEKIYRQKDEEFISILNAIRNNSITDDQISFLNKQAQKQVPKNDKGYIYITTTNKSADEINNYKLQQLDTRLYSFSAQTVGKFEMKNAPTDFDLNLKSGAQVMFLTNNVEGLWVNGTIGTVVSISADEAILVETQEGELVSVAPYSWTMYKYIFDATNGSLGQEKIGSFIQYPLKLAWAITIHKSQGKTFDRAIIDFGNGTFAHGQAYVALSRCRSFSGVILKQLFKKAHVIMDRQVIKFLTKFQYAISEETCSLEDKIAIIQKIIDKKDTLEILYLKNNDEKSRRIIEPFFVGEMEYKNVKYIGIQAFCQQSKAKRTFRVDRILEIG